MKTRMFAVTALALGLISFGSLSAQASGSCCNQGKCCDETSLSQFRQETTLLAQELNNKDVELRNEFGSDSIDTHRVAALEAQLNEIKTKIDVAGQKHGVPPCCRG